MSKGLKITLAALALMVVAACALVAPYTVLNTANADGMLYLKKGTSAQALTDTLTQKFGEDFSDKVMSFLNLRSTDIESRHGAYEVKKGCSPYDLASRLRHLDQSPVKFTFNNVRTKEQWTKRVAKTFLMTEDEIKAVINDSTACAKFGRTPTSITAILLPDSYEFYWDITPNKLIEKLNAYNDKFWNDDRKAKAKKLGLTPDEVVIVASIAEEETSKADERGKVGRLYINRIQQGMKLQADPTVKFAIGDFKIKRITNAMLLTPSPYNTYLNTGLPPGPIRLPEKTTIDAILDSEPHDFIFMCAKEDFSGYHNFAKTFAEHDANAKRYQAELNKRGIR